MKTLYLIPLLSLFLFVGCSDPDGDFWGTKAVIIHKDQNAYDKEKKQAKYTIYFDSTAYPNRVFIFPENWGEVGNVVIGGTNATIVAKPSLVEAEDR